jgi:hypothetical protein
MIYGKQINYKLQITRNKQKCLEQLWLEHVNRMETNRIVSNSAGVTDGRLSIREKKQTELSRTALESEVKGKIISKYLTMMVTQASQNYSIH